MPPSFFLQKLKAVLFKHLRKNVQQKYLNYLNPTSFLEHFKGKTMIFIRPQMKNPQNRLYKVKVD